MNYFAPDDSWSGGLSSSGLGPDLIVLCPVCGFNYNHIGSCVEMAGTDEVDGRRYRNMPPTRKPCWACRGNGIVIAFEGECGHNWTLTFQFHKGQCYVYVERLADRPADPAEVGKSPADPFAPPENGN